MLSFSSPTLIPIASDDCNPTHFDPYFSCLLVEVSVLLDQGNGWLFHARFEPLNVGDDVSTSLLTVGRALTRDFGDVSRKSDRATNSPVRDQGLPEKSTSFPRDWNLGHSTQKLNFESVREIDFTLSTGQVALFQYDDCQENY